MISQLMLEHFGLHWLERGRLDLRLRRPVRVDEPIQAYAAPSGAAEFSLWCENASGERVIEGTAGA